METFVIWLVLVSATALIITIDHRRRLEAARRANQSLFEVGKPRAYLILAFISTVLPLPVYFYATRKSWKGLGIGFAWVVAVVGIAVPGVGFLGARVTAHRAASECEETHKACVYAADMYYFGIPYLAKDLGRAAELLAVGCDGGDPGCCVRLEGEASRSGDRAGELSFRRKAVELCRKDSTSWFECDTYLEAYGSVAPKTAPGARKGELTPRLVAPGPL
jgi:hypothetical protein